MLGNAHKPLLLFVLLLLSACSKQNETPIPAGTSWTSILTDSLDLNRLAQAVEPHERSLHFSSSSSPDKTGLAHLAPQIFGDMDHGFFLRVEEHAEYTDAVLAEADGPGMISWVWSANPTGTLLIYIDDMKTPAVQMPFSDFINGKFLPVRYPFSAATSKGHNLHFPIIHSSGIKMVLRAPTKEHLSTFYYQIAWNALSLPVHPFSQKELKHCKRQLKDIASQTQNHFDPAKKEVVIPAHSSKTIFNSSAAGTIQSISFSGNLSGIRLQAFWDGNAQPSIDCPLHLLLGVSSHFEDTDSLPTAVKGSKASLRWPMPFGAQSRIILTNPNNTEISLKVGIAQDKNHAPLRLGAHHRTFKNLETNAANILDLADIQGPGRIAGCTIHVNSRTDQWWGEGDQLIQLDGQPAWHGTGTEDYFGFAWCTTGIFNHPLRGQTRVKEDKTNRSSTMHRYHILDTLPFHSSAQFQTEAWGLAPGTMDYESLILYYN